MIGITVISARIVRSPGCDGWRRTSRWRILPLHRKCPSQTSVRGSAYAGAKSLLLCVAQSTYSKSEWAGACPHRFSRDNEVISRLHDHIERAERSIQPPRYHSDGVARRDGSSGAGPFR